MRPWVRTGFREPMHCTPNGCLGEASALLVAVSLLQELKKCAVNCDTATQKSQRPSDIQVH